MEESKKWWASTGTWGSIVAILAGVAAYFGYQIDAALQTDVTAWLASIGAVVGGALALWGRLKATKKIA